MQRRLQTHSFRGNQLDGRTGCTPQLWLGARRGIACVNMRRGPHQGMFLPLIDSRSRDVDQSLAPGRHIFGSCLSPTAIWQPLARSGLQAMIPGAGTDRRSTVSDIAREHDSRRDG